MSYRLSLSVALVCAAVLAVGCEKERIAVTTYHYDNLRTGWDRHEEHLKPHNVQSAKFKMLHSVVLDDQVDTQPLIMPHIKSPPVPVPANMKSSMSPPKAIPSTRSTQNPASFFLAQILVRPCPRRLVALTTDPMSASTALPSSTMNQKPCMSSSIPSKLATRFTAFTHSIWPI